MPTELKEIPLQLIHPDELQPRTEFKPEKMLELKRSMQEAGLKKPLDVVSNGAGEFKLIDGERRWRAASDLGWITIPAIVYEGIDAEERLTRQVIGDVLEEAHGPVDRALSLVRLNREFKKEWAEIDKLTGLSPRRRRQITAILKLPKSILDHVVVLNKQPAGGRLTEKHCRALLTLDKDKQIELFTKIRAEKLSGDQALKAAQLLKHKKEKPVPRIRVVNEHVTTLRWKTKKELIQKLEIKLLELKG